MNLNKHQLNTSETVSDEVKTTTCYMCACRCGIRVHLKDGNIRYIEGNKNHPVNKGVLCAKGSAGIMHHYSPARLSKPLLRVGERGSGEFREVEWSEALEKATTWLSEIRTSDPKKLAFFTGRDQSQALTSWWAQQFGTPNYAAHGGFCSVNMAAGGMYTFGSAFWEFSEPDWDKTKYFIMFGVAEDHDSNPIKAGISKLKSRGAKFVSVNPVQTGYSAIADEWLAITPGTDGLFVLSLVHELLRAGKVDADYLVRYTNAPYLVINNPGTPEDGLFVRNDEGTPLCWDNKINSTAPAHSRVLKPALRGNFILPDGRKARPVFQILAEKYLASDYSPDTVSYKTGISVKNIQRIAADLARVAFDEELVIDQPWTDWTGQHHDKMIGRPVSMHAMRGISAHSNGFHTCRAIHLLQILLGSIDTPGGLRYKPPYPKGFDSLPRPTGRPDQVNPNTPLPGPHLGYVQGPEDLLVDTNGVPQRIDKAFSWDAPMSAHGMMHSVITNAWSGDPYKIELLFMYMANMAWNSAMNTENTINMLTDKNEETGKYKIPRIIYSDAFYSEMVPYADLILPDTTYLERYDCISMLDRPISDANGPADAIRHPVVKPDRDVRAFQDVILDIGARLDFPGLINENGERRYPGGYVDYLNNHERMPGVGMLAGWRGKDGSSIGKGPANPNQVETYIENESFWFKEISDEQKYFKNVNLAYLEYAQSMGFVQEPKPIFHQLYAEQLQKFRLAARGHGKYQPPNDKRNRIETYFDPLPFWYEPFENDQKSNNDFPLHAITQRPAAMYHSWGSQNAWLRQIHGTNKLYISKAVADINDIVDGDWVWLVSRVNRIKVPVKIMDGVNGKTVWTWNAVGKRQGAWNLDKDAKEATQGFLLNHLIDDLLPEQAGGYRYANSDPITGQAAWYDLRVRIEKISGATETTEPKFKVLKPPKSLSKGSKILRYGVQENK